MAETSAHTLVLGSGSILTGGTGSDLTGKVPADASASDVRRNSIMVGGCEDTELREERMGDKQSDRVYRVA